MCIRVHMFEHTFVTGTGSYDRLRFLVHLKLFATFCLCHLKTAAIADDSVGFLGRCRTKVGEIEVS